MPRHRSRGVDLAVERENVNRLARLTHRKSRTKCAELPGGGAAYGQNIRRVLAFQDSMGARIGAKDPGNHSTETSDCSRFFLDKQQRERDVRKVNAAGHLTHEVDKLGHYLAKVEGVLRAEMLCGDRVHSERGETVSSRAY